MSGIQGKPRGDCRRAENIALVNRYLGEYRYFLRKKSAVGPDFGKLLTDGKILTIVPKQTRRLTSGFGREERSPCLCVESEVR